MPLGSARFHSFLRFSFDAASLPVGSLAVSAPQSTSTAPSRFSLKPSELVAGAFFDASPAAPPPSAAPSAAPPAAPPSAVTFGSAPGLGLRAPVSSVVDAKRWPDSVPSASLCRAAGLPRIVCAGERYDAFFGS